jgi:tetratricopeptide (TPR) repeat protein
MQRGGRFFCALCAFCVFIIVPVYAQQNNNPEYWYNLGMEAIRAEDWYGAAELFIECVRLNPAHAEGTASLAECYYSLGEFDEALLWVRKARTLARASQSLANLEASVLVALGRLDEASKIIAEVLNKEPYNKEALFVQAELDIARGLAGDAVTRFRNASRRFPDDRRLLVSLALTLGSLNDAEAANFYIERALLEHPDDYRVYYYASYLAARSNRINDAINYAEEALYYRPNFLSAQSLLASLRYRAGQFEDSSRLADALIAQDRDDELAWYLKGISLVRLGKADEAITVLGNAASAAPDDEFIRSTLEELLISGARLEDPRRSRWASWHFTRAKDFRARSLMEQALFEYRRGLRLNPYAKDRREYADLLRIQGYPARFLEELKFMQDLGLGDTSLNDAVESYSSLLSNALFRRWNVEPVDVSGPHWKVAVFSVANQSAFYHADAGTAAASYIKDILVHERNISPMETELRQASFSQAYRQAREGGADYFLIVSVLENERDLSVKGEFFVARTGARAGIFNAYRTGGDRLRYASRSIVDQLTKALPFRGSLIRRNQGQGLIDKGRADGVADGDVFEVVRKNSIVVLSEGIGVSYTREDIVGKLTVTRADEEVSLGNLERQGFFDLINAGDDVFIAPKQDEEKEAAAPAENIQSADPELRTLLRTLR